MLSSLALLCPLAAALRFCPPPPPCRLRAQVSDLSGNAMYYKRPLHIYWPSFSRVTHRARLMQSAEQASSGPAGKGARRGKGKGEEGEEGDEDGDGDGRRGSSRYAACWQTKCHQTQSNRQRTHSSARSLARSGLLMPTNYHQKQFRRNTTTTTTTLMSMSMSMLATAMTTTTLIVQQGILSLAFALTKHKLLRKRYRFIERCLHCSC